MPPYFMVFGVESVGLHGDAYAVGYAVIDADGKEVEAGGWCVSPQLVRGTPEGLGWATDNAWYVRGTDWGAGLACLLCDRDMRGRFWSAWGRWKRKGAWLAADVPWPVKSRFLSECVLDNPWDRELAGPYPLIDVASVRLAAGYDPLATELRHPGEEPAHDPLADARQSARLLLEALARPLPGGTP